MLHINTPSKMLDAARLSRADRAVFPIEADYEYIGETPDSGSRPKRRREVAGLTDWQIKKVLRWIDAHVEQNIRIGDLASLTRLSVSRFAKGFKSSLGKPPYDYVLERRIEAARDLISSTSEPLSHIAHACGLSDQAHLSKVFKRHFGSTPRQYRLEIRTSRQPMPISTVWSRLLNPDRTETTEWGSSRGTRSSYEQRSCAPDSSHHSEDLTPGILENDMTDLTREPISDSAVGYDLGKYAGLLASASSTDQLLRLLASAVRDVLGADGAAIVTRNGAQCCFVEEDADIQIWKGRCISICGSSQGDNLLVQDVANAEAWGAGRAFFDSAGFVVLATRLDHQAVSAFWARWASGKVPTTANVPLVKALCDIAVAIYKVLQHESELSARLEDATIRIEEIRHRLKNAYASSIGLASLSMNRDDAASFSQRVQALTYSFDYLDKLGQNDLVDLAGLLPRVIEAFNPPNRELVSLAGPSVHVSNVKAAGIGLIINELAMNALKYGALSSPDGHVQIAWTAKSERVSLEWDEHNGPTPNDHPKAGTGSDLIQRLTKYHLAGTFEREFVAGGVVCRISFDANTESPALQ